MTDKTIGVFINLFDGGITRDQESAVRNAITHAEDGLGNFLTSVLLAIGTPIHAKSKLKTTCCIDANLLRKLSKIGKNEALRAEIFSATQSDYAQLVKKEDALALLAARDVEIAGLRDAVTKTSAALERVTEERMTSYQAKNGRWVSIQGDDGERCDIIHSDVTTDCEAAIIVAHKALKSGAA